MAHEYMRSSASKVTKEMQIQTNYSFTGAVKMKKTEISRVGENKAAAGALAHFRSEWNMEKALCKTCRLSLLS